MVLKKSDSRKHENSEACTVWEYDFPSEAFSFATALINGRYPDNQRSVNTECEQVYFVISGTGIIHSDTGDFTIDAGDLYFFEKNEAYWVEGSNLLVTIINTPKWSIDQYKHME